MSNKQFIARVARKMAEEVGPINISRKELCRRACIPEGAFNRQTGVTFAELMESVSDGLPAPTEVHRARAVPTLRKHYILSAAVVLATERGYTQITRAEVADAAGVSPALVTRYFDSMDELRSAIMAEAILKDIPRLIAQGLAAGDPVAATASDALKRRAAKTLLES